MYSGAEALDIFKRVFTKDRGTVFVKRYLWLVTQIATNVLSSTVHIYRLFYRSDTVQAHLLLYLLIDYIYRHSII
jgi:hypothetical protein